MSLHIGCINYVNIFPLTHFFEADWPVVMAPPAQLNAQLAEGLLDTSPISSIEYARHQDEYVLLPDLSISSRGAVRSVVLFSRLPLDALDAQPIGVCRATGTSRVLLRILLEDFVRAQPLYHDGASVEEARNGTWPAVLLIGDEALAFRMAARQEETLRAYTEYDLGQLWVERTGLPMVFAVWAMRREAAADGDTPRLVAALHASRSRGEALPDALLARASARTGMSADELCAYYHGLHFSLGPDEERALLTFYRHAARKGLCPPCDRLEFSPCHGVGDRGIGAGAR